MSTTNIPLVDNVDMKTSNSEDDNCVEMTSTAPPPLPPVEKEQINGAQQAVDEREEDDQDAENEDQEAISPTPTSNGSKRFRRGSLSSTSKGRGSMSPRVKLGVSFWAGQSTIDEAEEHGHSSRKWSLFDVISHNSRLKVLWDQFMGILILYTFFAVPLDFAFDPMSDRQRVGMDIFVTTAFFLNIVVYFRTTIEKTDQIIRDPREIALNYLKKWFWLDLIAAIPWDLLLQSFLGQRQSSLLQLLRLVRVSHFVSGDQFNVTLTKSSLRLLRLVAYALCAAHWLGCIWYTLSEYEGFSDGINGFQFLTTIEVSERSFAEKYLVVLHWGIWNLIAMGSELRPDSSLQTLLALVVIIGGVAVFAGIIGNIEVLLHQTAASSIRFSEKVNQLDDFFSHHRSRIPSQLKSIILRHVHHVYRTSRGIDERDLMAELPTETRNKVYRALYKPDIRECDFFHDCADTFVDALCTIVQPQIALRGDIVIRQGSLGSEMFIIHRGEAAALDLRTKEVFSIMRAGSFFGEISLFSECQRTVSVRARTFMELYIIAKADFLELLNFFPEEERRFILVAKKRVKTSDDVADAIRRRGNDQALITQEMVAAFFDRHGISHMLKEMRMNDVLTFFDEALPKDLRSTEVADPLQTLPRDVERFILDYLTKKAERARVLNTLDSREANTQVKSLLQSSTLAGHDRVERKFDIVSNKAMKDAYTRIDELERALAVRQLELTRTQRDLDTALQSSRINSNMQQLTSRYQTARFQLRAGADEA